jgi:hypothetical protein
MLSPWDLQQVSANVLTRADRNIVPAPARKGHAKKVRMLGFYWQATPFTANEVGAALVVLFQEPLNPIPE